MPPTTDRFRAFVVREADGRRSAGVEERSTGPSSLLEELATEIGLSEVAAHGERILAGKVRGRVVVDVAR